MGLDGISSPINSVAMVRALERIASASLAMLLAVACGSQGVAFAGGTRVGVGTPACRCCDFDPAKCATPSCCAQPAEGRTPTAPAPQCPSPGVERIALAVAVLFTLPPLSRSALSTSFSSSPIQTIAVPIFQRDCSFLI